MVLVSVSESSALHATSACNGLAYHVPIRILFPHRRADMTGRRINGTRTFDTSCRLETQIGAIAPKSRCFQTLDSGHGR
jgi:hypothetical protein